MAHFPTLSDLQQASLDQVLSCWSGLGYYARARHLHQAAQMLVNQFQGEFPRDLATLMQLPGIGRSTAAAILSLSYDLPTAILDGNVKRVLTRLCGIKGAINQTSVIKRLWQYAEYFQPAQQSKQYTQAMMDLGALVCSKSNPACHQCPLVSDCYAYQHQMVALLPEKKTSICMITQHIYLLIIENAKGEILLEKRPASGIWGGLWSLPESTQLASVTNEMAEKYRLKLSQPQPLTPFTHQLTHRRLYLYPIVYQTNSRRQTYPAAKWLFKSALTQLGIPTPLKKLFTC